MFSSKLNACCQNVATFQALVIPIKQYVVLLSLWQYLVKGDLENWQNVKKLLIKNNKNIILNTVAQVFFFSFHVCFKLPKVAR